jgi:hypothetical protein
MLFHLNQGFIEKMDSHGTRGIHGMEKACRYVRVKGDERLRAAGLPFLSAGHQQDCLPCFSVDSVAMIFFRISR